MEDRRLCNCHGEPMLFKKDRRYTAGGFHACAVANRERCRVYYTANSDRIRQRARDRYDDDPVFRIEKRLADDARSRRKTIERRRLGALPL